MRRKLELKEIMNNASLLKDMLDECEQNGAGSQPTEDELTTMKFLYDACKRLQPTILIILNDVAETECLNDAVDANEFLIEVFQSYHRVTVNRQPCADLITPMAATTNGRARPSTMDELSEIFASGGGQTSPVSHAANMAPLAPTTASPPLESNGKDIGAGCSTKMCCIFARFSRFIAFFFCTFTHYFLFFSFFPHSTALNMTFVPLKDSPTNCWKHF